MSKINPQQQFVHSFVKVGELLAKYGLPLDKYEEAGSGIENLTLIVWSGGEKFVLRVYRQGKKSDDAIGRELDFMAFLGRGGLPLPTIVRSVAGELLVVSEFDGNRWQCVLMSCGVGQHPKAYSAALVEDMAVCQARMHLLGEEYVRLHSIPSAHSVLRENEVAGKLLNDPATDERYREFLRRANAMSVQLDEWLPVGFSHFDYDAENLLADENDRVTAILDFDDAACMPLVVCLGYTLWDIATSADEPIELIERYLREYERVRPLSDAEKAVLPAVILYRHYMVIAIDISLGDLRHGDFEEALRWEEWMQGLRLRV